MHFPCEYSFCRDCTLSATVHENDNVNINGLGVSYRNFNFILYLLGILGAVNV